MIKKIIFHLFLSSVLTSQMAVAGPEIPLRNFAEYDLWGDIQISPTGKYLAGLVIDGEGWGNTKLIIIDTETRQYLHEINMTGRAFVARFKWVNDERLIAWEAVKRGYFERPFGTGNIIAVNVDGTKNVGSMARASNPNHTFNVIQLVW